MRSTITIRLAILMLPLALGVGSCDDKPAVNTPPEQLPENVTVPAFSADTAYALVAKQVSFGPRVVGQPGHKACGDWLVQSLKAYGAGVTEQQPTITKPLGKLPIRNIIASYYTERTRRIMLMAHWDTRPEADNDPDKKNHRKPIPGANDGGSGVGVLLELARILHTNDPGVGVDLFFWDAEDLGQTDVQDSYCLGAQYWSRNPVPAGYKPAYGILLDMVGAKGAQFTQEANSEQYAKGVLNNVWQTAHRLGYGQYFLFQKDAGILDDHYYVNTLAGIPSIDIIHRDPKGDGFFPQWHTLGDDMSQISTETLKAVGQTITAVVWYDGAMHGPKQP
jgi:Peptidase family M28